MGVGFGLPEILDEIMEKGYAACTVDSSGGMYRVGFEPETECEPADSGESTSISLREYAKRIKGC